MLKVQVEDWLATPEGRYAHSIQIPNPVPADSGYRDGMSSVEYLEHLCKSEAGEFIFKTVDDVEGIRLLRPRTPNRSDYKFQHLYAMEDPYGHDEDEAEEPGFQLVGGYWYPFIEMPRRSLVRNDLREFRDASHARTSRMKCGLRKARDCPPCWPTTWKTARRATSTAGTISLWPPPHRGSM